MLGIRSPSGRRLLALTTQRHGLTCLAGLVKKLSLIHIFLGLRGEIKDHVGIHGNEVRRRLLNALENLLARCV